MKRAGLAIVAAAMVVAGSGCAKSSSTANAPGGAARCPPTPELQAAHLRLRQLHREGARRPRRRGRRRSTQQHQEALGGYADFPGSTVKVLKSRVGELEAHASRARTRSRCPGASSSATSRFRSSTTSRRTSARHKNVGSVDVRTTGSNLDIAQQLQQYNEPGADQAGPHHPRDAVAGLVRRAGAAGGRRGDPDGHAAQPGAGRRRGERRRQQLPRPRPRARRTSRRCSAARATCWRSARWPAPPSTPRQHRLERVVASCPGMKIAGEVYGALLRGRGQVRDTQVPRHAPAARSMVWRHAGESVGDAAGLQAGRPAGPAGGRGGHGQGLPRLLAAEPGHLPRVVDGLPPVPAARAARRGRRADARRAGREAQHARRGGAR